MPCRGMHIQSVQSVQFQENYSACIQVILQIKERAIYNNALDSPLKKVVVHISSINSICISQESLPFE